MSNFGESSTGLKYGHCFVTRCSRLKQAEILFLLPKRDGTLLCSSKAASRIYLRGSQG
jgi:hypothetical protein